MLIVAPIGAASDFAHHLRANLAQRGLAVKLDLVSERPQLFLPASCEQDAKRARLCVVLGLIQEATHYAILPAPRFAGQMPDIAPVGVQAKPRQVEIGEMPGDLNDLAARIQARFIPSAEP